MLRYPPFFCLFYLSSSLEQALGWLASKFLWNNSSFTFDLSDFWHQKEQQMMKFLPKNVSVQSNGLAHVFYHDMAT